MEKRQIRSAALRAVDEPHGFEHGEAFAQGRSRHFQQIRELALRRQSNAAVIIGSKVGAKLDNAPQQLIDLI